MTKIKIRIIYIIQNLLQIMTKKKHVEVDYDIWYELNMIKLKNNSKYKSLSDVIQHLLEVVPDVEANNVNDH